MKKKKSRKTCFLLGIYCIFLVWIILLKLSFSIADLKMLVGERSVNFLPFYYANETDFHLNEMIMNVIIFIPIGIYLKMMDVDSKKAVLYGFVLSFGLELCQFTFKIGASDITDLLTNTTGTAIGVSLYLLSRKVFKNRDKLDKVIQIMALIATVLLGSLLLLLVLVNQ